VAGGEEHGNPGDRVAQEGRADTECPVGRNPPNEPDGERQQEPVAVATGRAAKPNLCAIYWAGREPGRPCTNRFHAATGSSTIAGIGSSSAKFAKASRVLKLAK